MRLNCLFGASNTPKQFRMDVKSLQFNCNETEAKEYTYQN